MDIKTKIQDMKTKWEVLSDDDFVANCGDYVLRVEQMDERRWWWCVYYKDDVIADSWMYGYKQYESEAKKSCVNHMGLHKNQTIKSKYRL